MLEALEDRCLPTSAGSATLVADINPGSAHGRPANLVVMSNVLYFAAMDGVHGDELWKSDGTASGTAMVKDINPGSADSYPRGGGDTFPRGLTVVGNSFYFWADDGVHGSELWKSDGTAAGTVLVKDINPGSGSSTPLYRNGPAMANVNGTLFFAADDGKHGRELWKSDGTAKGTSLVKDIAGGSNSSDPHWLTNVNGTLFFSADDGKNGEELWKSDGTAAGTVLVRDINPHKYGSAPHFLVNYNGLLVFSAVDGTDGSHVWKSDGTAAGTVIVTRSVYGPGGNVDPGGFTNFDGTLFFNASDGVNGYELWRTDGTAAGTRMVADIWPGSEGSEPVSLTNVNGVLFFQASDPIAGGELWKSDGTAAGTVLVKDINLGGGSAPENLTNVNGLLYFDAFDGVHGWEPWQSDGTATGTVLVGDVNPGSESSHPENLIAMNNKLYFAADDGVHGQELWDPPAVPTAGGSVVATPSGSQTIVPFKGHGSGAFTDASGDFFATGIASHLGDFTHFGTLVLTPTDDPFVFAISGRTVYQAANGDLLYAVTDGTLNILTGAVTGTDTWDGGTGRFAGASGLVDLAGKLLSDGSVTFGLLGNIAY